MAGQSLTLARVEAVAWMESADCGVFVFRTAAVVDVAVVAVVSTAAPPTDFSMESMAKP